MRTKKPIKWVRFGCPRCQVKARLKQKTVQNLERKGKPAAPTCPFCKVLTEYLGAA